MSDKIKFRTLDKKEVKVSGYKNKEYGKTYDVGLSNKKMTKEEEKFVKAVKRV